MNFRYEKFNCDLLMNDLLTRNLKNYSYWLQTMNTVYLDQFWIMLNRIMNDLLIAYLVKRYGKYTNEATESQKKLNEIAMKYNRVPRRSLNYYTPEEIMKKATGLDSLLPIA